MARRSFDIGPKRAAPAVAKPRRRKAPKEEKKATHPRLSTRAPKKKLRDRRREEVTRNIALVAGAILVVAGIVIYLFWRPEIRISKVEASGFGDTSSIESLASAELKGTYSGILPKNSFFFYPERAIRASILKRYPAISAVSVSRTGFDSIALKASERVSAFWWCGTPANLSAQEGNCYQADVEGLVFAPAAELSAEEAASSTPSDMLRVYAELDGAGADDAYPLRARVLGAGSLPDILRFARAVKTLGVPVASVAIRGDEADLFVPPSTRITYVVGHEAQAARSAEAAFKGLNLVDGSLVYVDLRFDGKVYLKRKGE